jgi:hypothetical protein
MSSVTKRQQTKTHTDNKNKAPFRPSFCLLGLALFLTNRRIPGFVKNKIPGVVKKRIPGFVDPWPIFFDGPARPVELPCPARTVAQLKEK